MRENRNRSKIFDILHTFLHKPLFNKKTPNEGKSKEKEVEKTKKNKRDVVLEDLKFILLMLAIISTIIALAFGESKYVITKSQEVSLFFSGPNYRIVERNLNCYSLQAAVNTASNGETIRVIRDVTEDEDVVINKSITIDLNGNDITLDGASIVNNGVLTIIDDSQTHIRETTGEYELQIAGTITSNDNAIINNEVLEIDGNVDVNGTGNSTYTIENLGDLTLTDGVISGTNYGAVRNGNEGVMAHTTITGGTVIASKGSAIVNEGVLEEEAEEEENIENNGEGEEENEVEPLTENILLSGTGVVVSEASRNGVTILNNSASGKVKITGGEVLASGTAVVVGNGNSDAVVNHSTGEIEITGGSIESATAAGIAVTDGDITITGGEITGHTYGMWIDDGTVVIGTENNATAVSIIGETEDGILNNTADITIYSGEIESRGTSSGNAGVRQYGEGTITIGKEDNVASISVPSIFGENYGLSVEDGTVNFYDGIITGAYDDENSVGQSIYGDIADIPEGYTIIKNIQIDNETTYEYAVLSNSYITSFDANYAGASAIAGQSVTYGSQYGTLPTPTRTGYTFNGWNGKNLFDKNAITSGYEISGTNIVQNANWFVSDYIEVDAGATYTISGKTQGAAILYYDQNKENVVRGPDAVTGTITIPSGKKYIRINGLLTEKDTVQIEKGSVATQYESYYVTATTVVTTAKDHTLKANWTANTYTVVFNANNGTGTMANQTITYDTTVTLTTNTFTRVGYKFTGWSTTANNANGSTTYIDGQTVNNMAPSGTVNLYAIWVAANYGEYDSNGVWQRGTISLQEAVDKAATGNTIKPITTVAETTKTTINAGKNIILDLNGNTITYTGDTAVIDNKGTLLIKDSSQTNIDLVGSGVLESSTSTVVTSSSSLTITGGTILGDCGKANGVETTTVYSTGSFNMTGGKITSKSGAALISYGSTDTISGNAIIEKKINDNGTFYSSAAYSYGGTGKATISGNAVLQNDNGNGSNVVYNSSSGTIEIGGNATVQNLGAVQTISNASTGTITIKDSAQVTSAGGRVILNGYGSGNSSNYGTIQINGGQLSSSGEIITNTCQYGVVNVTAGTISTTSSCAIGNSGNYASINISGGTISATGTSGSYGTIYNSADNASINISGGTITKPNYPIYNCMGADNSQINITGGTITSSGNTSVYNHGAGTTVSVGSLSAVNNTTPAITGKIWSDNSSSVNVGAITVNSGTITGTSAQAIDAGGNVFITGGVLNGYTAAVNASGTTVTVTGGTLRNVQENTAAITNSTGTTVVSGNATIIGGTKGIYATTGNITVTGGTITSTQGEGIYATTGTITIGDNTDVTVASTTSPSITGALHGVQKADTSQGALYFYDGAITAPTGKSIVDGSDNEIVPIAMPEGYRKVITDNGNSTETARLSNQYTVKYPTRNLIYGLNDCGVTVGYPNADATSGSRMSYSISSGVVTVTSNASDGYGMTSGRVNLEANRTYRFSCSTNGTYGGGATDVEIFLMLDGRYTTYYRMNSNNNYEFTPTVSGTYWLRLDVNNSGATQTFSDLCMTYADKTTQEHNAVYGTLPNPTRDGYTFNGWYLNAVKATTLKDNTTISTSTGEIYANNNYILSDIIPIEGGRTLYSNVPICGIYTFDCYGRFIRRESNRVTTHSISANARYMIVEICKGDDNEKTIDWYRNNLVISDYSNASGVSYINSQVTSATVDKVAGDHCLFSKWTANQYTLTINPNGGTKNGSTSARTLSPNLTYNHTDWCKIGESSDGGNATRTGYTLTGYYTSASGGTKVYNADGTAVNGCGYWSSDISGISSNLKYIGTSKLTVYAQWTANQYTLTINPNGGTKNGSTSARTLGTNLVYNSSNRSKIGESSDGGNATRHGYTLTGYYTSASGGTKVYNADGTAVQGTAYFNSSNCYIGTSNLTVYAQWSPNTYTITFNANGGTGAPANQSFTFNAGEKISSTVPSRQGYTFVNWKRSDTTHTFNPGDTIPSGWGNFGLVAQWTANTYTVTFNSNSGSGTMSAQTMTYDTSANLTANAFTKTGYTFVGWSTAQVTTKQNLITAIEIGRNFTKNGNNYICNQTASTQDSYLRISANMKSGRKYVLIFNASGVPDNNLLAFDFPSQSAGNSITLKNGMNIISFTATSDLAQGILDDTAKDNRANVTLSNFVLYETAENMTNSFSDGQSVKNLATSGNVNLYALWTANTYTVTFNSNGGSGTMSAQTMTYDAQANLTANTFTKTNYTFAGWSTSASDKNYVYDNGEYSGTHPSGQSGYTDFKQYYIAPSFAEGDVYQLDVDVKGTGSMVNYFYGGSNYLKVASWQSPTTGNSGTNGDGNNPITLTSEWKHYTVRFTLSNSGNGAVNKYVLFRVFGGNTAYIKNIRFNKVSSSSIAYVDQHSVSNLATSGNVNLYAIWTQASPTSTNPSSSITQYAQWIVDNFTSIVKEDDKKLNIFKVPSAIAVVATKKYEYLS